LVLFLVKEQEDWIILYCNLVLFIKQ